MQVVLQIIGTIFVLVAISRCGLENETARLFSVLWWSHGDYHVKYMAYEPAQIAPAEFENRFEDAIRLLEDNAAATMRIDARDKINRTIVLFVQADDSRAAIKREQKLPKIGRAQN